MLRAGNYQLEIHGTSQRVIKRAAEAVADGVEKWVKQNRKLLEERRGMSRRLLKFSGGSSDDYATSRSPSALTRPS